MTRISGRIPCDILLAVDADAPWSGGSRIYYDNLYRRLAGEQGLNVHVETTHCPGDDAYDARSNTLGLTIHRSGARLEDWKLKRAPALLSRTLRIAAAAVSARPEAIHCGDLFPQDLAGMLLRRATGLPLLVFCHGDEVSQTESRRLQPRLRNAIYRSADALVAANTYAYDRLAAICGTTRRITLITPGVDTDIFHPGARPDWIARKFDLGADPVLVTIGRLVKKKGHETVLRGLPTVLKVVTNLKYLVVGGGPEEARLNQLEESLSIAHAVRFTGDVPHHQLGDYYRAGDLFAMVNQQDSTGDIESFGMVFIEAGASGKAVVGGRSGGTAESIVEGTTGLLCQPGDSAQLSQALLLLLANPGLRERLAAAGLARARSEFNWQERASRLFNLHNAITGRRLPRIERTPTCPR